MYWRIVQKDWRKVIDSRTGRCQFLPFGMGNRWNWVRFKRSLDGRKQVRKFTDGVAEVN
jgi:hypothetical protein